uniref:Putative portal protein n=1 Tax=viral metagenome TaxID=1070528 RepID=A0A6M3L5N5_9ZZZZ
MTELWLPESIRTKIREQEIASDIDSTLNTVLKEYGVGAAEYELAVDDIGWDRMGLSASEGLSDMRRVATVKKARAYYIADPLSKQAVRTWTNYSMGRGISWKADDGGTQDTLKAFWTDKVNQPILSAQGQRKSSDMMLVDGEVFFVFFKKSGDVKVRRIDPLEITEIITDPDDKETPKLYKRQWSDMTGATATAYYPDWLNDDSPDTEYKDSQGASQHATEQEGIVYHIPFMNLGSRGISLLISAMDWSKAHRKFLEARAAITQSLALFAWKAKTKGSSTAVNALKTQLQSTYASGTGAETNPPPARAATWIENEAVDMQPIRVDTGASNAQVDGNMLLQLFGTAVGIFPHYFGAGEAFRLATATAMERPMRVQFEAYQQLWADIYDNIFNYVMDQNNVSEDKRYVDIDFPPIVEKDATDSITAIVQVLTVIPELIGDDIKKLILTNLGVNNPDEVLENLGDNPTESAIAKLKKDLREVRLAITEGGNNGHKHEVSQL